MIMLAFVAKPEHVSLLIPTGSCGGVFYTSSGWVQLGMQVLAVGITTVFSVLFAGALFYSLKHWNLLRVNQTTELAGIDHIDHGGSAYPEFNNMHGEWWLGW